MRIKVIPFKIEHYLAVEKRAEIEQFDVEFFVRANRYFLEKFPSITGMVGDTYIACGGFVLLWPYTAELWAKVSPEAKPYSVEMNQIICNFITDTVQAFSLSRLQATVRKDFVTAKRWVEFLGFKKEGLLKKYFNNHDYIMYSKIIGV
jgi:RimJ/RimL family protein N-acetyltransferase